MNIIFKAIALGITVILTGMFLPGISTDNFVTAILVGLVLTVLNMTLRPILKLLTLPISIVTFGLFSLVINTLMILITVWVVPGFEVDNILWAFAFSVIFSIVSTVIDKIGD